MIIFMFYILVIFCVCSKLKLKPFFALFPLSETAKLDIAQCLLFMKPDYDLFVSE